MNNQFPRVGVPSHVQRQGSAAPSNPIEQSTADLAEHRRRRELRRFHPHNLADDSKEPLPAHAAGEPVPQGKAAKVESGPIATFFAITVALAVLAYSWAWFVILPIIGLLWLAGWL